MITGVVPFLTQDQIERDAAALLGEFSHAPPDYAHSTGSGRRPSRKAPEADVGVQYTHELFGIHREPGRDPDILGAIYFDDRRIVVAESP